MNRIFRKVWSRALGAVVVASELAKRARGVCAGPRVGHLRASVLAASLACVMSGGAWAQEASSDAVDDGQAQSAEETTDVPDASVKIDDGEPLLPVFSDSDPFTPARTDSMMFSLAGGGGDFMPMSVVVPPPATGGTLPGVVQYLNDWLLGNDYQACTALSSDCLTISRSNFDYSYLSLILNLIQAPNVLDLDGNQPGDHLTLIGSVHSDSYITLNDSNYFGNNNDAECIIIGLACTWQTNSAQNNQVIIGDGSYANGSNTVVMGTNARHQLPTVTADSLGWTGGPDDDYASRLGNAVVIGDNAFGSADRQTILGFGASSTHANSVALGADSVTLIGAQTGYAAFGLDAPQDSAGEVSIGSVGAERKLTNVAAGESGSDAVNVEQLQGALSDISALDALAVQYDDDGAGNPTNRVTLVGDGSGAAVAIGNLAAGVADDEAVNVGQLSPVVDALGGGAAIDPVTGAVTGPTYTLDDGTDTGTTVDYGDVGGALENLDGRTAQNTTNITNILDGTAGLVRQDPGTLQVTIAAQTGGDEVAFANVDGDARRLTGVADGVDDSDGANMGQLRDVEDQIGDLDALAVKYDDATQAAITLAGAAGTTIGNLAAGEVSATSSEAVNGAQLFGVSSSIATHLGGGSVVNIDGSIGAPTYNIQGGSYNNVGDAFDAVDDLFDDVVDLDALAVKYDDASQAAVTLGGAAGTTLGNLAAGAISVDSMEAINGAQLFASHTDIADFFGGGAGLSPTGGLLGPTYFIQGSDYDNVGDALAALNDGLDDINDRIDDLPPPGTGGSDPLVSVDGVRDGSDDASTVAGSKGVAIGSNAASGGDHGVAVGGDSYAAGANDTAIGGNARVEADGSTAVGANTAIAAAATNAVAVGEGASVSAASGTALGQGSSATASNAVALGQGSVADVANTVSVGSAGSERQITNVAAGVRNTDAANVGQLNEGVQNAITQSNAYTDNRINQFNADLHAIDRGYQAATASALAVAGLPQAYLPGKSMIAVAAGGYKNEGALAVGITTISESGRWIYKFSGTTNTVHDVGVTAGAGLQW